LAQGRKDLQEREDRIYTIYRTRISKSVGTFAGRVRKASVWFFLREDRFSW
jgi:hypothetical protein